MSGGDGVAALAGVRVAEFGTGRAAAYCGKLFADFGAHVVKVEPPGGDPGRAMPPLVDVGDGRSESAVFAWLNTNKQSLTAEPDDAVRLTEIAASVDVLIDARPDAWDDAGPAGHAALRAASPNLIITHLSAFGVSGPYKDFAATDSVVRALAGLVRGNGPAEAPIFLSEHQAYLPPALSAFSAAVASLIGGGPGRRFEVSAHDANTLINEFQEAGTLLDPTKYDHPVTMLYVDEGRLTLVHYCDAGNRPRMTGQLSPDGTILDFEFADLSGGNETGHMYHAVFTMIDETHHIEEWTYMMPGDKPVTARFDLHRTN